MVLGGGEKFGRFAIAQGMQGDFHPFEQFLDDQICAGLAKGPFHKDLLDGMVRLGHVAADQHSFAERQAVGFDGATATERGGESRSQREIRESACAGGGDAILLHELLREDL